MKFHYLDEVVTTDPFFKILNNPSMPESEDNKRKPCVGVILSKQESFNSEGYDYTVAFKNRTFIINEQFLTLASEHNK